VTGLLAAEGGQRRLAVVFRYYLHQRSWWVSWPHGFQPMKTGSKLSLSLIYRIFGRPTFLKLTQVSVQGLRSRLGKRALGKCAPGWANGDGVLQSGRTISLLFRRPPAHLLGLIIVGLQSWRSTAIY